jgi:NACHT domain
MPLVGVGWTQVNWGLSEMMGIETLIQKLLANKAIESFGTWRERRSHLDSHLRDVRQEVSLLVTYRPTVQHIEDAFVPPKIMDGALARVHVDSEDLERLIASLRRAGIDDRAMLSSTFHRQLTRRDSVDSLFQWHRLDVSSIFTYDAVLVLGAAGAGKSVLLAYLCWMGLEEERPRIPLFLTSKSLLSDGLEAHILKLCQHLHFDFSNSRMLSEVLAFYIDGLDELPRDRDHEICNDISVIRRKYDSAPLAATCRSSFYGGELDFLRPITLLPFDETQSAEFVRRWFRGAKGTPTADDFLKAVTRDDRLSELATQPLLLALMCNAFRRYRDFSRRQTTLFEQCVSTLLWQWDAERSIKRKSALSGLDQEKRLWLHAAVANHFHESQRRFLSKRELSALLVGILPRFGIPGHQAETVLLEISSHQGLLVQWAAEAYGFGHLALQEYLAARWLANERRWARLIRRDNLLDPWWINVIGLAVASLSDATAAIEQILNVQGLSELDRFRVAAHCLKYDPLVEPVVRERVVRRVLDWYHNGDARQHDAAMRMLVGIDDDWSAGILRKSLAGRIDGSRDYHSQ